MPPAQLPPGLKLTNLDKVYWPADGFKKQDLLLYYAEVAPALVPHLRDRPQSLNRHPDGITGENFFQKDVSKLRLPPFVETVQVAAESKMKLTTHLLVQNDASLVYMANLGCIEINPWSSRVNSLENPDYLIMDLDPQDLPFSQVSQVAVAVRKLLDKLGVACLCKTSGKRGLHVLVPLGAKYLYEPVKLFAELLARLVNRQVPDLTSIARLPAQRRSKVYLDYLQNGRGKTIASVYSARPWPGGLVSTPLKWSEVRKTLDPAKFTIKTVPRRLDKLGDLWQDMLGPGIDLQEGLQRIGKL
jgi:bifunctional non-homologous end joining protein LigD